MSMRRFSLILVLGLMAGGPPLSAQKIRPYLSTGPWYSGNAIQLKKELVQYFNQAKEIGPHGRVTAIVSPHAGFSHSGRCAASAYRTIVGRTDIRRVILLGVSHRGGFYGGLVSTYDLFATPLGTVRVDRIITEALQKNSLVTCNDLVMEREHSLENQLPFLQYALKGQEFSIVPLLFGSLKKDDFSVMAELIRPYVDPQTLIVVSTDLTHYGVNYQYTPFTRDIPRNLEKLDKGLIDALLAGDFEKYYRYRQETGITACGFVPAGILLKLLPGEKFRGIETDYYRSDFMDGNAFHSVSYASIVYCEPENVQDDGDGKLDHDEQKILLKLARETLQHFLEQGARPPLGSGKYVKNANLNQETGVFVTLRENHELRGCIGSIVGSEPLYRGVMENAVNAAVHDPRFPPVTLSELPRLHIEISVMTPLKQVEDYRKIRLGTDGVIIRDGNRQAVFLPQVAAETGWPLDRFLSQLCLKAGLPADAYRRSKSMQFHVFQAQVFKEEKKK